MKVGVPREIEQGERRVALVPDTVKMLVAAGLEVAVEAGAGAAAYLGDDLYQTSLMTLAGSRPLLRAYLNPARIIGGVRL